MQKITRFGHFTLRFAIACLPAIAAAQFYQPVFPGLQGQELVDSLVANYKSSIPLDQADGRDTLFAKIYNHDDSLTCVYTGFTIWLDPAQDPTIAAFMNGGPDAINTEHTYPQSLGASGNAEGDLHHLYPSRADVNAARANSPFAEIPDDETEEWYYLGQKKTSIPTAHIERYSERKGELFEPREDHKGNVARAMLYFYTMYKEQADMANADFFWQQLPTICTWRLLDPVDEAEWNRTFLIAAYQEGKPNPFVLDPTLAERVYSPACQPVAATEVAEIQPVVLDQNAPNPFTASTTFRWQLADACHVRLEIFDPLGRKTETLLDELQSAGEHFLAWEKPAGYPQGLWFYCLTAMNDRQAFYFSKKMLVR
jgi:hypothetical protein